MHPTDTIKSDLAAQWHAFEAVMVSSLHSDIGLLNKINDYLLDKAGKQLRPLLALVSAAAGSGSVNDASITCAAAAEMMHTATLLHDDVVDESDMRRGALTVRSLFSPGASVLMGDYWLSKVVNLLVGLGDMKIMSLFAKTIEDLASGEMLQMEKAQSLDTTEKDYLEIIRCKTASLFVSSIVSAAIASGAGQNVITALGEYALNLGYLFQVRDDILDYSDTATTGKDTDCDISERKITLPLICAFRNDPGNEQGIKSMMSEIDLSNPACDKNTGIIAKVKAFVLENSGIESARRRMETFREMAVESIEILPESRYRGFLASVAEQLVSSV